MTELNTEALEAPAEEDIVVLDPQDEPAAEPKAEPKKRRPLFDGLDPDDADYGAKVQKRISRISGQRRAAEAERDRALSELANLRKQALNQVEHSLTRDHETALQRHQRAFSEGDAEAVSRAAAEMADIAARRAQVQQAVQNAPAQQRPQFSERTQEWIDERPWFSDHAAARGVAYAAHKDAVDLGLKPDTDDYFAFVDEKVRSRFPKLYDEQDEDEDEPARPRSAAPPVAPARRTAPGAPARKSAVSLTAAEAETCRQMGWDVKRYAANKLRLTAAGKFGK